MWASRCDKGLGILAELAVRQRHRRQGGPLLQPIATHSPRPTHQELRLVVAFLPLLHALCSRLGKRQGALDGAKVHGCRGGRGHQGGEGRAPGCSQRPQTASRPEPCCRAGHQGQGRGTLGAGSAAVPTTGPHAHSRLPPPPPPPPAPPGASWQRPPLTPALDQHQQAVEQAEAVGGGAVDGGTHSDAAAHERADHGHDLVRCVAVQA